MMETNPGKKAKKEADGYTNAAYVVNHALACTATDILSPYIGNFTQTYLGKRIEVGCGHDHSDSGIPACDRAPILPVIEPPALPVKKGLFTGLKSALEEGIYKRMRPVAACEHVQPASQPAKTVQINSGNLKHWWIGELAGDFGAVPFTLALQRFAPGLMRGIRHVMEPVLAPLFHRGARRAAKIEMQGRDGAQDVKALENSIYEREMSHISQAFVWTVSSSAINLATQKLTGNKGPVLHLLAGKLAGSATSAALVVGLRGFAPQQAYHIDQFTSRHVFEPVGRVLTGSWQQRVASPQIQNGQAISG